MIDVSIVFLLSVTVVMLLLIAFWEYHNRSAYIVFPLFLVAVYAFPLLYRYIAVGGYSNSVYFLASMWGVAYVAFYSASRVLLYKALLKSSQAPHVKTITHAPSFLYVACFVISYFVMLIMLGLNWEALLSLSWAEMRGLNPLWKNLHAYLFYFSSGLGLLMLAKKKYFSLFVIFLLVFFVSLTLKSRGFIVTYAIPMMVFYMIAGRLSKGKVLASTVLVVLFVFLYVFIRFVRHAGGIYNLIAGDVGFSFPDAGEFGLIDGYLYLVDKYVHNIEVSGMGENVTLMKLLQVALGPFLNYISDPVVSSDRLVWNAYTGILDVNGSYHPTVIGLAFFDSPLIGYAVYPVFIAIVFTLYQYLSVVFVRFYSYFFSIAVVVGAFVARGSVHNGLMLLLASCVFIFLYVFVERLLKIFVSSFKIKLRAR